MSENDMVSGENTGAGDVAGEELVDAAAVVPGPDVSSSPEPAAESEAAAPEVVEPEAAVAADLSLIHI